VKPTEQKSRPRVLLLDIETAPLEVYCWGLFDQNIGLNQIIQDWSMLCWSAKWLGEKKMMYEDLSKSRNVRNDKRIVRKLWHLVNEADIIVGQNGKRFDTRKMSARFILLGMDPPSSYRQIDTLQIARKHFGFTSNKLEYLSENICTKYKKKVKRKFPGFSLWSECLKGNKVAWAEMAEYNKLDVLALEELLEKFFAWDNTINFGVYTDNIVSGCVKCGGRQKRNGYHYSEAGKYQRFKCIVCKKEVRSGHNMLTPEKRRSLGRRISR